MELKIYERQGIPVVRVSGQVKVDDIIPLGVELNQLLDRGLRKVIINMRDILLAHPQFVNLLVGVRRDILSNGGSIALIVSDDVFSNPSLMREKSLFRIFSKEIFADEEAAIQSFMGIEVPVAETQHNQGAFFTEQLFPAGNVVICEIGVEVVEETVSGVESAIMKVIEQINSPHIVLFKFTPGFCELDETGVKMLYQVKKRILLAGGKVLIVGAINISDEMKLYLLSIFPGEWFSTLQEAFATIAKKGGE